jgi:hypothetical protein
MQQQPLPKHHPTSIVGGLFLPKHPWHPLPLLLCLLDNIKPDSMQSLPRQNPFSVVLPSHSLLLLLLLMTASASGRFLAVHAGLTKGTHSFSSCLITGCTNKCQH